MSPQKITHNCLAKVDWQEIEAQLQKLEQSFQLRSFLMLFASVERYNSPNSDIDINRKLQKEIKDQEILEIALSEWKKSELVRAYLLMKIQFLAQDQYCHAVNHVYQHGDNSEKIAILKSLSLLPHSSSFLSIAQDAHRSNVVTIFSALALDNPFISEYFDQSSYNNVVLKAIFLDLPILKICGIQKHRNKLLAKMIEDWMDEREAASRTIMPQVWPIIYPFLEENGMVRCQYYLKSKPEHAHWIKIAQSSG